MRSLVAYKIEVASMRLRADMRVLVLIERQLRHNRLDSKYIYIYVSLGDTVCLNCKRAM
jgi:hypothetical protein